MLDQSFPTLLDYLRPFEHGGGYTDDYKAWLSTVETEDELNGGGDIHAPIFESLLSGRHFKTAFEWCAGPAWIGLWLLERGICDELVTGDINPRTVELVKKTAKKHGYKVRSYLSDNMKSIPSWEKFDLVVGGPPNYCNIQESHRHGWLRNDLRAIDRDWNIHADFYNNIRPHLFDHSIMYISEVSPYDKEVYLEKSLYDLREELPINEFVRMTERNGLRIKEAIPYEFSVFIKDDGVDCRMLEIEVKG